MKGLLVSFLVLMLVATSTITFAQDGPGYSHTGDSLVSGVRLIDGLGNAPKENQDILFVDGRIAAIGPIGSLDVPEGALEIDGTNMTAMPGLIDMHVHIKGGWANSTYPGARYEGTFDDETVQQVLSGYLYSGVTTVQDVGADDHDWKVEARDRINGGDLFGPRTFITGGVWTQKPSGWDGPGPTIVTDIESIPSQMEKYEKAGIEIIKLYTGMSPYAAQFVIEEAHERDILVIADFWQLNMDKIIMQASGLDGYAHSSPDAVSADNNQWLKENNRFVIVTANVGEMLSGLRVADENGQRSMLNESLIVDIWGKEEVGHFYDVYPEIRVNYYDGPESFYQKNNFGDMTKIRANFFPNIKGAYDAGVLIAGGSDTPYASLWPGESMHRELELLVMAGIPPLDAIKICTHNASKILRREDKFGSLQVGLSADMIIVEGNPAENISDSRNVRHVFSQGRLVNRDTLKLKR
jgi:hypothetical protein